MHILRESKILFKFENEEYEDLSFPLRLEYFNKILEQGGELHCLFLDECGEKTNEPNQAQTDALEFFKAKSGRNFNRHLNRNFKKLPKMAGDLRLSERDKRWFYAGYPRAAGA